MSDFTIHSMTVKDIRLGTKDQLCLHLLSVVFAYSAILHSMPGYHPYDLMLVIKHQLSAMHGMGWQNIIISIHKASVHGSMNNANSSLL